MEIRRTFDIIALNCEQYPRKDMYAGKADNSWVMYSPEDIRNNMNLISYGLLSMGYAKGDKIATISPNKPEWNIVDHALAQAGMIHVPVYPTISTEEYEFILGHSDVKAIFVGNKSIYGKVSPIAGKIAGLRDIFSFDPVEGVKSYHELIKAGRANESLQGPELDKIRDSIEPEDLVTIIYTSGTTGNSKGVMLSHRNLVSNALTTSKAHHLAYGNRAISFLPLCHVYERMVNYHFQYKGISIYYIENMGTISEVIKEVKPHIFNTVPRLLEKIYDNIISKGRNLPWIK